MNKYAVSAVTVAAIGGIALLVSPAWGSAVGNTPAKAKKTYFACAQQGSPLTFATRSTDCPSGQRLFAWNAKGKRGAQGPAGPQGEAGEEGRVGPQGAQGPIGLTGAPGPAGPQGSTGSSGPEGPAGPQGVAGPQGPSGPAGPPGPASTSVVTTVTALTVNKNWGPSNLIYANCPSGQVATGGGVKMDAGWSGVTELLSSVKVIESAPYDAGAGPVGWQASFGTNTTYDVNITASVYAVCAG